MVEQAEDELFGIPQPPVPRIPVSEANTKKLFRAIRDKIRGGGYSREINSRGPLFQATEVLSKI